MKPSQVGGAIKALMATTLEAFLDESCEVHTKLNRWFRRVYPKNKKKKHACCRIACMAALRGSRTRFSKIFFQLKTSVHCTCHRLVWCNVNIKSTIIVETKMEFSSHALQMSIVGFLRLRNMLCQEMQISKNRE